MPDRKPSRFASAVAGVFIILLLAAMTGGVVALWGALL
jgi:hypothetical protein